MIFTRFPREEKNMFYVFFRRFGKGKSMLFSFSVAVENNMIYVIFPREEKNTLLRKSNFPFPRFARPVTGVSSRASAFARRLLPLSVTKAKFSPTHRKQMFGGAES